MGVNLLVEAVVHPALVSRPGPVERAQQGPGTKAREERIPIGALRIGLIGKVLVGGGRGRDVGGTVGGTGKWAVEGPQREKADVVRVHEAGHEEERAQGVGAANGPPGIAGVQPSHHPISDDRVAHEAGVAEPGAVGFGPDPAREAERAEGSAAR